MKKYGVHSVFDTLQGEGSRAGERSVFVRFRGCNLWDGTPEGRSRGKGACARWCDTEFVSGSTMALEALHALMEAAWPANEPGPRWAVFTGGEPGLQVDKPMVDYLQAAGWNLAIETNGTVAGVAELGLDHIAVSPKRTWQGYPELLEALPFARPTTTCELKVVLPGSGGGLPEWQEDDLLAMANMAPFGHLFVVPQDQPDPTRVGVTRLLHGDTRVDADDAWARSVQRCVDFVKAHPEWRLGVQAHKLWRLP